MNPNRLALIIAYYLARFDTQGVSNLGFKSMRQAFDEASTTLGINRNYIKLRRDEFDKVFPWRVGWKAPMSKQILKTIEALQDLPESDLRTLVVSIIQGKYSESEDVVQIVAMLVDTSSKKSRKPGTFVVRNPTGRKAEEFFIKSHSMKGLPVPGTLKDTRDLGCGYDFEIHHQNTTYFVEVKGLSEAIGGIVFTDKEWLTARKNGDRYFLAIVTNLKENAEIFYVQNPAASISPKRNLYSTIQVQWSVQLSQLSKHLESSGNTVS